MIPWAMIIDRRLTHDARRVFAYLQGRAFRIEGTGAWEPVRAQLCVIAEDLGYPVADERERRATRRRMQRAIRQLESLGYLRVMRWPGRGRANAYDLNPAWAAEAERATLDTAFSEASRGDVGAGGKKRRHIARKREKVTPSTAYSPEKVTPSTAFSAEKVTPETAALLTDHSFTDHSRPDSSRAAAAAVLARLLKEGVSRKTAERLISECGVEVVEQQIEWLPQRRASDRTRMLVAAIKGNYPPPPMTGRIPPRRAEDFGPGGEVVL
jgi:hypothetical protein